MSLNSLAWEDYAVFGCVFSLFGGISVYYAFLGSKGGTTEDFLLGNRKMKPFPVGMSLFCSFISAIAMLGTPTEIYFYGTQKALAVFSFIPLTLTLVFIYIPVYFQLQLTSVYEYLEVRFNRKIRLATSITSIVNTSIYLSIIVYSSSLALSQVSGISHRIVAGAIFVITIVYSSLGGLKGVVSMDVFVAMFMVSSLVAILFKGIHDIGIETIFEKASETDRLQFFNFDFDPRTRYTVFTSTIGDFFGWITSYAISQITVQKFVSIASISGVSRAIIYNGIGLTLLMASSYSIGLIIYAKYSDCDPVSANQVTSSDQLLPLFVMESFPPGFSGFFVAGLAWVAISSAAGGLNALSAIITEDFVKHFHPNLKSLTLTKISRFICVLCGLVSFSIIFALERTQSIFQATVLVNGVFMGTTFGVYSLGMFSPFVNSRGVLMGQIVSVVILVFQGIGSLFDPNLPNQRLALSVEGCENLPDTDMPLIPEDNVHWKDKEYSMLTNIFSISYVWTSLMGAGFTMILGGLFSMCFSVAPASVNPKHLSPVFLSLWKRISPVKTRSVLIQPEATTSRSQKDTSTDLVSECKI